MSSSDHRYSTVSGYENSSQEPSAESSATNSRRASGAEYESRPQRERPRVRFSPGGSSADLSNLRPAFDDRDDSRSPSRQAPTKPLPSAMVHSGHKRGGSGSSLPHPADTDGSADITDSPPRLPIKRSRPGIFSLGSSNSDLEDVTEEHQSPADQQEADEKSTSQRVAQSRAENLSRSLRAERLTRSAPGSKLPSPVRSPPPSPPSGPFGLPLDLTDIPLADLGKRKRYGIEDDTDEDEGGETQQRSRLSRLMATTKRLINDSTSTNPNSLVRVRAASPSLLSGYITPMADRGYGYIPPPKEYRGGILASLLKLYNEQGLGSAVGDHPSGPGVNPRAYRSSSAGDTLSGDYGQRRTNASTPNNSPPASGTTTPKGKRQKWYYKNAANGSASSISSLITSSAVLAQPGGSSAAPKHRPAIKKNKSSSALDTMLGRRKGTRSEDTIHIQYHIQETLARQKYLQDLCRALMTFGAPTHRLEEYMRMSARVLQIDGQFLYIPGCMLISFDDSETHTTEVKIVRSNQAVDLGKLRDTHEIYKETMHDLLGVAEASKRLNEIMQRSPTYGPWTLVFVYGLASAFVGPFAFQGRPIDMPIAFMLGCILGFMQLILAPKSELYANVLEVSAAVVTSFLARAFGSIRGGDLFCFSALAQSAIALILPGYLVLCGALELQSRNMVAGSVRMVYAIIYSLFLGFGITIGTSFYGGLDKNAISEVSCRNKLPGKWPFLFVPPFTLCLIIISQGKWKQAPIMLVIAFIGYIVNHYSAIRFASNVQIANTLGALAVGVLGNLYSRTLHGLSAAALIPAIFVQVPSGLAASGSLVSGLASANQITNQTASMNATTTATNGGAVGGVEVNNVIFNVGFSMIQVAIGITVGLFLSSLVVYPFGKRRSGLFSF